MSDSTISGEMTEELYSLTGACFFASCWQGHDELEQAVVDWAKRDFQTIGVVANENPVELESLMREAGDETLAAFINDLDKDLRREALSLISEYLQEAVDDDASSDLQEAIDEIISELT